MTKAFDINGTEIKRNAIVKVVNNPEPHHSWLKEGNTLRASYWENRSFSNTSEYIVVFLESKKGGRLCSQGLLDRNLLVMKEQS